MKNNYCHFGEWSCSEAKSVQMMTSGVGMDVYIHVKLV